MKSKGLSGSALKWIAILTMVVDHLAAGILEGAIYMGKGLTPLGEKFFNLLPMNRWLTISEIMRNIGRLAFPIFAFLLIEGFFHTSNGKKMAKRLLVFAFISEVPFDLVFNGTYFYPGYQNIFFTLFFGFLAMAGGEYLETKGFSASKERFLQILVFVFFGAVAFFVNSDYGPMGIFAIGMFYFLRGPEKWRRIVATVAGFSFEFGPVFLAALPIYFYNGTRGKQHKYFFYWFYPCHLLVIAGLMKLIFS